MAAKYLFSADVIKKGLNIFFITTMDTRSSCGYLRQISRKQIYKLLALGMIPNQKCEYPISQIRLGKYSIMYSKSFSEAPVRAINFLL